MVEGFRELRLFNAAPWIGEVDVPTSVVVTTGDHLVPPARQRKLAEAIPGARVLEVDGDHDVCVSGPRRFVPALVEACRWAATGDAVSGRACPTAGWR